MRKTVLFLMLLTFALTFAYSCGKKAPPHPPEERAGNGMKLS